MGSARRRGVAGWRGARLGAVRGQLGKLEIKVVNSRYRPKSPFSVECVDQPQVLGGTSHFRAPQELGGLAPDRSAERGGGRPTGPSAKNETSASCKLRQWQVGRCGSSHTQVVGRNGPARGAALLIEPRIYMG
jgi:hypothetical protein